MKTKHSTMKPLVAPIGAMLAGVAFANGSFRLDIPQYDWRLVKLN